MPLTTTVGQLLVNNALPEDMRDYNRTLDKKQLEKLFTELADKHPDKYREVSHRLAKIGARATSESGGFSFGLSHLTKAPAAKRLTKLIQDRVNKIIDDPKLSDDDKEKLIISTVGKYGKQLVDETYQESLKEKNPLALQVLSGSRGNPMNLASLRASDLLYEDYENKVIPLPILRSYSQGLTPAEYWAATYGARQGVLASKFSIADAGYLGKQLNQIMHRKVVTALDGDVQDENRGLPVDVDDSDNEGALLARAAGPYKRNQVLTPKVLKDLQRRGIKKLLVRSPAVGGPPDGGLYAYDAGVREGNKIPALGTMVGNTAAQAINEPIAQGQLSQKHSGGVSGHTSAVSGFAHVNSLLQIPKNFKGGAAHAQDDGRVQEITEAPGGGYHVTINGKEHYVPTGAELKVKPGDEVEAGDTISTGIPNPREIVTHKGVGEGRRYLAHLLRDTLADYGMNNSRRNTEILAGSLINHVRLNEQYGDHLPNDLVPYNTIEASWEPRDGYQTMRARSAVGKYLERPVLHYSIGTKIRPSVVRTLDEFGISDVDVHDKPPPFQSEMVRGAAHIQQDPDWLTRMYGSSLKKTLLEGTHRGDISNPSGTSFVPSAIKRVDFGREGPFRTPGPGIPVRMEKDAQNGTTNNNLPPPPSQNPAGAMPRTPPPNSVQRRPTTPRASTQPSPVRTPTDNPNQPGSAWRSMVNSRMPANRPQGPYNSSFNPGNLPTWLASAPVVQTFFNDMHNDPTMGQNNLRSAIGFGSLIDSNAIYALTRGAPARTRATPPTPQVPLPSSRGTLPSPPLAPGEQPIPAAARQGTIPATLATGAGLYGALTYRPPTTPPPWWSSWLPRPARNFLGATGRGVGYGITALDAGQGAGSVAEGYRQNGMQGAWQGWDQFGQEAVYRNNEAFNSMMAPYENMPENAGPRDYIMRTLGVPLGALYLGYSHYSPTSNAAAITHGVSQGAQAANEVANAAAEGPGERVYRQQNAGAAPPPSVGPQQVRSDERELDDAVNRQAARNITRGFNPFSSLDSVTNLSAPSTNYGMNSGRYFSEARARRASLEEQIEPLSRQIAEAQASGDTQTASQLITQRHQVLNELSEMERRLNERGFGGVITENMFNALRSFSEPYRPPVASGGYNPSWGAIRGY